MGFHAYPCKQMKSGKRADEIEEFNMIGLLVYYFYY